MRRTILAFLAFLLIAGTSSASVLPGLGSLCTGSLTPPAGVLSGINTSDIITVSMLIVLAVMFVLGLVYGLGYAFKIDSLLEFSRNEVVESLFNVMLIAILAAGISSAGGIINFISNLGLSGITAASSQAGLPGPSLPPITSAYDIYNNLCQNFVGQGVTIAFNNVFSTSASIFVLNLLKDTKISIAPWNFGIIFEPFAGLDPIITVLSNQLNIYLAIIVIYVGLAFALIFIYNVFPMFLYAGVLLRSLPWTRAAGGSLLAFFIAFYILFPALVYPFEATSLGTYSSLCALDSTNCLSGATNQVSGDIFGITSLFNSIVGGIFGSCSSCGGSFSPIAAEINGFAGSIANIGVQFIGIIIGLLMSYDIVESLGDLLGAPSLHSKTLLSKVI